MDLRSISLAPLQGKRVAILGYGNQGRAHALNLRDSGIQVLVGAREKRPEVGAFERARRDGFAPLPLAEAAASAEIVMFLLPDQAIPSVYEALALVDKTIGFCHGFAFHYGLVPQRPGCRHFMVSPKGAGALLRRGFEMGGGLPGAFALADPQDESLRALALAYAKAIGCASSFLEETTFAQETEGDLFAEQTVLCGGILRLMEAAFQTLVRNGHDETLAFFDCCYEAKLILELWMKYGPAEMAEKISPTALYGGWTRGRRLVDERTEAELEKIFQEIRSGAFTEEWMAEVKRGMPTIQAAREALRGSLLEKTYRKLPETLR